jgi:DNA sulfur modification protein DndE
MGLFKTSTEVKNYLESFRRATGLRPNIWARAALGYSLSFESYPDDNNYDSNGQEFPREVFYGKDEQVFLALLRQRHGITQEADINKLVKLHVERGIRHLWKEFERVGKKGDEFLISLLETASKLALTSAEAGSRAEHVQESADFSVSVEIGEDPKTGNPLSHVLNAPGLSPHIAIMGRTRSGKTRTGLDILEKIDAHTSHAIPFLIFDYAKGDIADNNDFTKETGVSVIRLPKEKIPMAPLALSSYDDEKIKLAARRFVDTIKSVVRLGPKQVDTCLRIIKEAYHRASGSAPDIEEVLAIAEEIYETEGKAPDSLLVTLRDFADFPVFRSPRYGEGHDFLQKGHVIDLSKLPEGLKKICVFLILDRIYSEIMERQNAPLDSKGYRQMRLIVAIDEAHNYLPCKQPTLEKFVRESASKGVGIMLMSQSPDDFDQPKYNFAKEMGLVLVFSCFVQRPKMLEALLGGNIDPQLMSQLPSGIAKTRLPNSSRPVDVRTWA